MKRYVWVVLCGWMLGCGSAASTGTAAATLVSVEGTDAEVGKQGMLRVRFDNPVLQNTDVTLNSTDATVVRVPAKITVPRGALAADIAFDALAIGDASIFANSGTAMVSSANSGGVTVVSHFMLEGFNTKSTRTEKGALQQVSIFLDGSTPTALPVALAVDDGSVLKLGAPSTTITPFSREGYTTWTALAPGTTAFTATLGTQTVRQQVTVVDHARLVRAGNGNDGWLYEVGALVPVSISLDASVAKLTSVSVTSSDTSVVGAPSGLMVQPGNTSGQLEVPLLAPGSTTLSFTLADSMAAMNVYGVAKAQLKTLSLSAVVGQTNSGTVQLDAIAGVMKTITLSSSDPTLVTVPAQVFVEPNGLSTSFPVTALAPGIATITATLDGVSTTSTVQVASTPPVLSVSASTPRVVMVGATIGLTVSNSTDAPTQLSSSDPTVLAVPAQVAGGSQNSTAVALKAGSATVTATSGSLTATTTVRVVTKADFTAPVQINVAPGTMNVEQTLVFEAIVPAGTPITFTSSNPAVAAAPATVYPDSNGYQAQFFVDALTSGTTVITLTALGQKHSAVMWVGQGTTAPPFVTSALANSSRLEVGAATYGYVQLSSSAISDVPLTVTSASPAFVSVTDANPTVIAGQTSVSFPLVAVAAGSSMITVSGGGATRSFLVTVVATPTFTLSINGGLSAGTTVSSSLSSDCLLAKDRIFDITSTSTTIATVSPATVTLTIQSYAAQLSVSGVAMGTSVITATPRGSGAAATATATVAP